MDPRPPPPSTRPGAGAPDPPPAPPPGAPARPRPPPAAAGTPPPPPPRPWYEAAFAAGYLEAYAHRDLAAARAEAASLVARGLAGRVLDLGCGFGRHALALAELGLPVAGLDLSAVLLARAAALPGGKILTGRIARGDLRALPFAAASFDAVLLLFSSFGYFDEAGNARVLDEVARVLRPGGTAIFDLMNAARVRATLVPESRTERDGRALVERRRLEEWGRRVVKEVLLRAPDGTERSWREDVRLYGPEELRALLAPRGLEVQRVEGDFDGRPPAADAPRCIVWAERSP
ncbi:MAG: class I SAM-dependent methyltransferase [Planctomycetota bacterium]